MGTDRVSAIRAAVVYVGLLVSEVAGAFLLGAYAQGFKTLDQLRERGSDGYPWTWQAALLVGLVAAAIALLLGLAAGGRRSRTLYWTLCLAAAVIGALIELADPSPILTWIGLFGLPLVGAGGFWATATAAQHPRRPTAAT